MHQGLCASLMDLFCIKDEHFKMLQREATALAGVDCHYRGNSAILEPAAAACHRTKRHKTKSAQQPVKNEIQVIYDHQFL